MNKIIFLGTGAASSLTRQMTSILFVTDKVNFLIDCGDGMGTVRNIQKSGTDIHSVSDIFLTHKHADHINGLTHLLFIRLLYDEKAKIRVFGPKQTLKVAKELCFSTHDLVKKNSHRVVFIPIPIEKPIQLSNQVIVTAGKVKGPPNNPIVTYGYKIMINDKTIVFSSDMQPSSSFDRLAKGSDIMIHDCFGKKDVLEQARFFGHSVAKDAGEAAQKAGCKHLVLTHFKYIQGVTLQDLMNEAKLYFNGKITTAEDLMEINI